MHFSTQHYINSAILARYSILPEDDHSRERDKSYALFVGDETQS